MNIRKRKRRKVKRTIFLLTLTCFIMFLVMNTQGSHLWNRNKQAIENKLRFSYYSIKIIENFPPVSGWLPKQMVTKRVAFSNTGDAKVLLRVSYVESWKATREGITLSNTFDHDQQSNTPEVEVVDKGWSQYWIQGENAEWVYGNDGYFYYTKMLPPGNLTQEILETITLHEVLPDIYANGEYQLTFKAEALLYDTPIDDIERYWNKRPIIDNETRIRW